MGSYFRDYLDLSAHKRPMVGDTKTSALSVDHLGWLVCDGRHLNVSEYPFLFNTIYYKFGGSGTLFRLPDPAGRTVGYVGIGTLSNASLTTRTMGNDVGEERHTLTIPEMPSHGHTGTTSNAGVHNHSYNITTVGSGNNGINVAGSAVVLNSSDTSGQTTGNAGEHNHDFTTGLTGGSQSHNNMQPTLFFGNLFIYSGKPFRGNYPFTAGIYVTSNVTAPGSNVV